MLFDHAYNKHRSEGALAFLIEILQCSTVYSLIVTDLAGTILLWNEGARRLYGYDPVEVIGKANSEVLHSPEDIAAGLPTAMREEALRNGKWEGTVSRVRKNALRFKTCSHRSLTLLVSIFQTLQLHVEDTKTGVLLIYVMAIADEVDLQLPQGMKSYISEAKCDARPIEAWTHFSLS
jgi:PAS domain S-box-containing protein